MSERLHWREIRPGDLVAWKGFDIYDRFEQVLRIERRSSGDFVATIFTNTGNGIAVRPDSMFETIRRTDRYDVAGVVIERFADDRVHVDGERHPLVSSDEHDRIPPVSGDDTEMSRLMESLQAAQRLCSSLQIHLDRIRDRVTSLLITKESK